MKIFLFLILKYSRNFLYIITLIIGIILIIRARNWFSAWIGLEVSLIAFIPLVISKNKDYSRETRIKYFIIQRVASVLVLLRRIFLFRLWKLPEFMLISSLIIKNGAAPLHFWFPRIIEGLDWSQSFLLITFQKIGPLSLLSWLRDNSFILLRFALVRAIVGAYGGINELKLNKLLAFSSINHLCWVFAAIRVRKVWWGFYFFGYSFVLFTIIYIFSKFQIFHLNHIKLLRSEIFFISRIVIISLGGIPPFLGFFPKLIVINLLVENKIYFLNFVFILTSVITLYYYCRILISLFISLNTQKFYSSNWKVRFCVFINCTGVMFITPLILL